MPPEVIVDTSAWIEFFRRQGDPYVKLTMNGLLSDYAALSCGPVEMEFFGGLRTSQRIRLKKWFSVVPYLKNDQKIWRKAAEHYALLRERGITAPWNDILIATISLERGHRIYACDKHFRLMAPILNLLLYKPGYNGKFDPDSLDMDF